MNVPLSVAHLHDQALVRRASRRTSWDTTHWSADAVTALLLDSSLPRAHVVIAFRLPALVFCPSPISAHYYSCDFCNAHVDHPGFHVSHACPSFPRRSQWAFVRLLATLPKSPSSYLSDSTTVVQPTSGTSMSVGHRSATPPAPRHRTVVYSASGLVRYNPPRQPVMQVRGKRSRSFWRTW